MSNKDKDNNGPGFLGPSYNYVKHIRSPEDMQLAVSGSMWEFGNDIAAIGDYIALLIAGPSRASKLSDHGSARPIGNSFMMKTVAKCTDVKSNIPGTTVPRSIFVNNIPLGNIPFLSSIASSDFSSFRGLIPGVAENLNVLNPIAFSEGLMQGGAPPCVHVNLPTIDNSGNTVDASGYLTITDIQNMDPCAVTQAVTKPTDINGSMGIPNNSDGTWASWNKITLRNNLGIDIRCDDGDGDVTDEITSGRCSCSITNQIDQGERFIDGFQNINNTFPEKNLTEMWIIILGILGLYLLLKMMKK